MWDPNQYQFPGPHPRPGYATPVNLPSVQPQLVPAMIEPVPINPLVYPVPQHQFLQPIQSTPVLTAAQGLDHSGLIGFQHQIFSQPLPAEAVGYNVPVNVGYQNQFVQPLANYPIPFPSGTMTFGPQLIQQGLSPSGFMNASSVQTAPLQYSIYPPQLSATTEGVGLDGYGQQGLSSELYDESHDYGHFTGSPAAISAFATDRLEEQTSRNSDTILNSQLQLQSREMTHGSSDYYQFLRCEICNRPYKDQNALQKHRLVHLDNQRFYCKTCRWGFDQKCNFDQHCRSKKHENKVAAAESNFTSGGLNAGPSDEASSQSGLATDRLEEQTSRSSDTILNSQLQLSQSLGMTHGSSDYYQSLRCEICNRQCKDQNALQKHRLVHLNNHRFYCKTCQWGFNDKQAFDQHCRSKKHENKVAAAESNFTSGGLNVGPSDEASSQSGLATDRLEEQTSRSSDTILNSQLQLSQSLGMTRGSYDYYQSFVCEICNRACKDQNALQTHRLVHLNNHRFYCETCQWGFNDKKSFERHCVTQKHENKVAAAESTFTSGGLNVESPYEASQSQDKIAVAESTFTKGSLNVGPSDEASSQSGLATDRLEEQTSRSSDTILNSQLQLSQSFGLAKAPPYSNQSNDKKSFEKHYVTKKHQEKVAASPYEASHSLSADILHIKKSIERNAIQNSQIPLSQSTGLTSASSDSTLPYQCAVCQKVCHRTLDDFISHLLVHLDNKSFFCYACKLGFNIEHDFFTHCKSLKHLQNAAAARETSKEKVSQEIADQIFDSLTELDKHLTEVYGEKPYLCAPCDLRFKSKRQLSSHMRTQKHKNIAAVAEQSQIQQSVSEPQPILPTGANLEEILGLYQIGHLELMQYSILRKAAADSLQLQQIALQLNNIGVNVHILDKAFSLSALSGDRLQENRPEEEEMSQGSVSNDPAQDFQESASQVQNNGRPAEENDLDLNCKTCGKEFLINSALLLHTMRCNSTSGAPKAQSSNMTSDSHNNQICNEDRIRKAVLDALYKESRRIASENGIKRHIHNHREPYKCQYCDCAYANKRHLTKHYYRHKEMLKDLAENKNDPCAAKLLEKAISYHSREWKNLSSTVKARVMAKQKEWRRKKFPCILCPRILTRNQIDRHVHNHAFFASKLRQLTDEERLKIYNMTRNCTGIWRILRKAIVTGTRAHRLLRMRRHNLEKFFANMMCASGSGPKTRAMARGLEIEKRVLEMYRESQGIAKEMFENYCGLIIHRLYAYLGATPDAWDATSRSVIELKCPVVCCEDVSRRTNSARFLIPAKHGDPKAEYVMRRENYQYTLDLTINPDHQYYAQCMMQIACSNASQGIFVVYWEDEDNPDDHEMIKIVLNKELARKWFKKNFPEIRRRYRIYGANKGIDSNITQRLIKDYYKPLSALATNQEPVDGSAGQQASNVETSNNDQNEPVHTSFETELEHMQMQDPVLKAQVERVQGDTSHVFSKCSRPIAKKPHPRAAKSEAFERMSQEQVESVNDDDDDPDYVVPEDESDDTFEYPNVNDHSVGDIDIGMYETAFLAACDADDEYEGEDDAYLSDQDEFDEDDDEYDVWEDTEYDISEDEDIQSDTEADFFENAYPLQNQHNSAEISADTFEVENESCLDEEGEEIEDSEVQDDDYDDVSDATLVPDDINDVDISEHASSYIDNTQEIYQIEPKEAQTSVSTFSMGTETVGSSFSLSSKRKTNENTSPTRTQHRRKKRPRSNFEQVNSEHESESDGKVEEDDDEENDVLMADADLVFGEDELNAAMENVDSEFVENAKSNINEEEEQCNLTNLVPLATEHFMLYTKRAEQEKMNEKLKGSKDLKKTGEQKRQENDHFVSSRLENSQATASQGDPLTTLNDFTQSMKAEAEIRGSSNQSRPQRPDIFSERETELERISEQQRISQNLARDMENLVLDGPSPKLHSQNQTTSAQLQSGIPTPNANKLDEEVNHTHQSRNLEGQRRHSPISEPNNESFPNLERELGKLSLDDQRSDTLSQNESNSKQLQSEIQSGPSTNNLGSEEVPHQSINPDSQMRYSPNSEPNEFISQPEIHHQQTPHTNQWEQVYQPMVHQKKKKIGLLEKAFVTVTNLLSPPIDDGKSADEQMADAKERLRRGEEFNKSKGKEGIFNHEKNDMERKMKLAAEKDSKSEYLNAYCGEVRYVQECFVSKEFETMEYSRGDFASSGLQMPSSMGSPVDFQTPIKSTKPDQAMQHSCSRPPSSNAIHQPRTHNQTRNQTQTRQNNYSSSRPSFSPMRASPQASSAAQRVTENYIRQGGREQFQNNTTSSNSINSSSSGYGSSFYDSSSHL